MAVIFVCAGGMLGLLSAVTALAVGHGALVALAIWSGVGTAFSLLGLTMAMMPRQEPARIARRA